MTVIPLKNVEEEQTKPKSSTQQKIINKKT